MIEPDRQKKKIVSTNVLHLFKIVSCLLILQFFISILIFSQIRLSWSTSSTISTTITTSTISKSKLRANHPNNVKQKQQPKQQRQRKTWSQPRNDTNKIPLIIGGSDGSGTRSFVELLARLGVLMLLDDPVSLDVGGSLLCEKQGWPPLAKLALTHRASPVNQWPETIQNKSKNELLKLKKQLNTRLEIKMRQLATTRHIDESQLATNVSFGFKAPVTMLLLPMIQAHMYPQGFLYLHVVRDGRDIALSSNQSPVKKFYMTTYPDDAKARIDKYRNMSLVMAMQLWNDWNVHFLEWATQNMVTKTTNNTKLTTTTTTPRFDFMVVRSEDFVQGKPETKLRALQQLAHFVGSPLTRDQLCCLSQRDARDMGQSHWYGANQTSTSKETPKIVDHDGFPHDLHSLHQRLVDTVNKKPHQAKLGTNSKINDGIRQRLQRPQQRHEVQQQKAPDEERLRHRRLFEYELLERVRLPRPQKSLTDRVEHHLHHHNPLLHEYLEKHNHSRMHHDKFRHENLRPLHRRHTVPLDYGDETLGKLLAEQLEGLYQQMNLTKSNANMTQRYGKWSKLLDPDSSLYKALHVEGAQGLEMFGYEPWKETWSHNNKDGQYESFVCHTESLQCPAVVGMEDWLRKEHEHGHDQNVLFQNVRIAGDSS